MRTETARVPDELNVRPWHTAVGRHGPDSPYVIAWLGVLGPTATWAWTVMARSADQDGWTVPTGDLARTLGVSEGKFRASLSRMASFGVAEFDGDVLWVRSALPDLPERLVGRLSGPARAVHDGLRERAGRHDDTVAASSTRRMGLA